MRIDLTDMIYVLSFTLDAVEADLLGLDTGHCRRVAYLAVLMGKAAGFKDEELRDFGGCCLLHDNALTEFIHEELVFDNYRSVPLSELARKDEMLMNLHHSILGERNMRMLPFKTDIRNIIQHHHENADGSGALKRTASQTSLKSQILHLADTVDISRSLMSMQSIEFDSLLEWVKANSGKLFSKEAVELFEKAISFDDILYLQKNDVREFFMRELHATPCNYTNEEIHNIAEFFAEIVDYKSEFTECHSKGVAEKAELMARYYGFDSEKATRFYVAGAMHDIGKLIISNDLVERPDKNTSAQFADIKNHAAATYKVLSKINGIPDIVSWASNHHERLNGSGFPRGLSAKDLSFEDQLLACVDIYQGLTERNPYNEGMPHAKAISKMLDMAAMGEINEKIVRDIDLAMADL